MRNLLVETLEYVGEREVLWVGSSDGNYSMTWDEFKAIADIEYSSGYGAAKIAQDLIVVGDSWWLERHEYDGSEWWEFKELPQRADNPLPFERVKVTDDEVGWRNIDDMNGAQS